MIENSRKLGLCSERRTYTVHAHGISWKGVGLYSLRHIISNA